MAGRYGRRTFTRRDMAEAYCRTWVDPKAMRVMVEGPSDNEITVMALRDAIAEGLTYSWVAPVSARPSRLNTRVLTR